MRAPALPREPVPPAGDGPVRRALLLTDPELQGVLAQVLRARCFVIRRAVDADSALARLAAEPFDLVVLSEDPQRGVDGEAFTRGLRRPKGSASRRAWVLVVARHAPASDVRRLRNAGVSSLLVGRLSLRRLQERLALMDTDQRAFVDVESYTGPDRRVATDAFPAEAERRRRPRGQPAGADHAA